MEALQLRHLDGDLPSITTIYRVIRQMGIIGKKKHKPNGITKADRDTRKLDELLKRDFSADEPYTRCVTDITEIREALSRHGLIQASLPLGVVVQR